MDTKSDLIKNKKTNNMSSGATKNEINKSTTPIHNTAGGEMPDPNRMPSKTKFHTDTRKNSKGDLNARISK